VNPQRPPIRVNYPRDRSYFARISTFLSQCNHDPRHTFFFLPNADAYYVVADFVITDFVITSHVYAIRLSNDTAQETPARLTIVPTIVVLSIVLLDRLGLTLFGKLAAILVVAAIIWICLVAFGFIACG
jgi:hypothetical protein